MNDTLLLSDLPEPVRSYAEAVGLENLKRLARQSGGKSLYIPTEECLNKYGLKRLIVKEYKEGEKIAVLSQKYGISISTVYRYTHE